MVQYTYKKGFTTVEHNWFIDDYDSALVKNKSDVLICHAVALENLHYFDKYSKQATLITDLSCDLDLIFQKFNKNYRYEIRRAEKENVVYKVYWGEEIFSEPGVYERFIEVYNQMYKSKGMDTVFNRTQVLSCIKANCIVFTVAFYNEEPLVFHSYIYDKMNTRFYYSASPFREQKDDSALIARMNKGLHWHDIQLFKSKGIVKYDWGGVQMLSDLRFTSGIAKFKAGFGGEYLEYYNCKKGKTFWGKLIMLVLK